MSSLQAISTELLGDLQTPVSAFVSCCQGRDEAFLFESGEAAENFGRYSIVAWDSSARLSLYQERTELETEAGREIYPWQEFFDLAQKLQERLQCRDLPNLPFVGGLCGYVGYDAVRLLENLSPPQEHPLPIAVLWFPTQFVVFDNFRRKLTLVAIAQDSVEARDKIKDIQGRLNHPISLSSRPAQLEIKAPSRSRYLESVRQAKKYIMAGDIFQVVLSDSFKGSSSLNPFNVYRCLRVNSPSPYMFYLKSGNLRLVGSSPETLVRVEQGRVIIRPIAGTRGRHSDPVRDRELEKELVESEKERAEHIMLVDLARNDVGRVCRYGSVAVDPLATVERFSHVMHMTSQVEGELKPELTAWEAFKAAFPAGTVSGAPKVRAMEIIDELENYARGPYAGAIGYFGPQGNSDTCIGIRMIQFLGDEVTLQVGAGIVADSIPEMEYQEIQDKAAQGLAALNQAAEGLK